MRDPATPAPGSFGDAIRAIDAAIGASDLERAAALADCASAHGLVNPIVPVARALWLERLGRDDAALSCFQQARKLSPRDARIPNAIGLCLARLRRLDEAVQAFDDVIRLDPSATAHQRKAWALALAGRIEESELAYEKALKLAPRNVETLASLASLAARKGDTGRVHKYARRALALDPANANAQVALAIVEVNGGDYKNAIDRLRPVIGNSSVSGQERSIALGLLGDALDGEGDTSEAFANYAAANAERRKTFGHLFLGRKSAGEILDEVTAAFAETPAACWARDAAPPRENGPAAHVFLLGFPRSGTTLLEQALENNSAISTLDEQDFLADIAGQYLSDRAGVEALSTLDESLLEKHRQAYWRKVEATGLKLAGRVFVDKHPFHTVKLPLIARLFPRARVLFALRDPRDVVLSCFRRQLELDLLRFEFLTLEGAAEMYGRFMCLADLCRAKLPLSFCDVRYEDLIADFDAVARTLCAWLDVPWQESMRDIAANAAKLSAIKASTAQIRRGLYQGAAGHWRRYRSELEPVLPGLEAWVERFGYAAI